MSRGLSSPGDGYSLMSIVAVEDDKRTVIDLREYLDGGKLVWTVPDGNWTIEEYVCRPADRFGAAFVNFMDYDASMDFVNLTYKRFTDRYQDYIGDVVKMTFYDDLQYNVPNRRMWDRHFNEVFEERYGFDPAPYYPALWENIGVDTEHYKAMFMDCRAHMFAEGFFKAVGDFTRRNGLISTVTSRSRRTPPARGCSATGSYGESRAEPSGSTLYTGICTASTGSRSR